MSARPAVGTLALIGGGEWRDGCRGFDTELLAAAPSGEVVVLPSAAAFEHPERVAEAATTYLESLGAKVRSLMVLRRADAEAMRLRTSFARLRSCTSPTARPCTCARS